MAGVLVELAGLRALLGLVTGLVVFFVCWEAGAFAERAGLGVAFILVAGLDTSFSFGSFICVKVPHLGQAINPVWYLSRYRSQFLHLIFVF